MVPTAVKNGHNKPSWPLPFAWVTAGAAAGIANIENKIAADVAVTIAAMAADSVVAVAAGAPLSRAVTTALKGG